MPLAVSVAKKASSAASALAIGAAAARGPSAATSKSPAAHASGAPPGTRSRLFVISDPPERNCHRLLTAHYVVITARYSLARRRDCRDCDHGDTNGPQSGCGRRIPRFSGTRSGAEPSRGHIGVLRAVGALGNGHEVPGVVAVQGAAVHHVRRDLLLGLTHVELMANQVTGRDRGLGRLMSDAVGMQRRDEDVVVFVGTSGRGCRQRANQRDRQCTADGQQRQRAEAGAGTRHFRYSPWKTGALILSP